MGGCTSDRAALTGLRDLFVSSFSAPELREFLFFSCGPELTNQLPEGTSSTSHLASEAVRSLQRMGFLSAQFFGDLRRSRTRLGSEIDSLERMSLSGHPLHGPAPSSSGRVLGVPVRPTQHFVGRDDLIAELISLLRATGIPKAVAIEGGGGFGKTELALRTVYHPEILGSFDRILWLDGASPILPQLQDHIALIRPAAGPMTTRDAIEAALVHIGPKFSKGRCPGSIRRAA